MILLIGCIKNPKSVKELDRTYYLKAGEVAPIEGWLVEKNLFHDIMIDALKNRQK